MPKGGSGKITVPKNECVEPFCQEPSLENSKTNRCELHDRIYKSDRAFFGGTTHSELDCYKDR